MRHRRVDGAGKRRHWMTWLLIGVGLVVVLLTAGTYVFIHFIQSPAPAPLALSSPTLIAHPPGTAKTGGGKTAGIWSLSGSPIVGYRVDEVLFGQSHTAVGRTSSVTGSLTVRGRSVVSGDFTADMTTVTSDDERRDAQFQGRIMETSTYPTTTFELTAPIQFGTLPADGTTRSAEATGALTLHGVTRTVTFKISTHRVGATMQVVGSIPITFADWNISNPSFGGVVTTQDHGELEFQLNLAHAQP